MKRSGLVRLQVFLLIALAGLLVWRVTRGPDIPESAVAITDLSVGELASEPFALESAGRVRIEATGSVEEPDETLMAAYPWILAQEDRTVRWTLNADSARPGETQVSVVDTLRLEAGSYTAYFATFGPTPASRSGGSFLGLRKYWTNDEPSWQFLLTPVDSIAIARVDAHEVDHADSRPVWSSGPVRNRARREGFIVLESTGDLRVRAILELCSGRCDEATIENALTGQVVWSLSSAETEPAGGTTQNRFFDGPVALDAGVYRVRVVTDGSHAYGSWRANPPWDPESWGMSISADSVAVREFDPWVDTEPYVAMLEVRDDEHRRTTIQVDRPVRVVVDAMGEISTGGNRYDYAWIERADRSRIWEMDYDASGPAGGDVTNRREVAFLDLTPGRYTVYYQSDGSHAYRDWRRSEPTHPERWGVAIFPLSPESPDSAAVRVVDDVADAPLPAGAAPPPPPAVPDVPSPIPPTAGETVFSAVGLGNGQDRSGEFELNRRTRLRIIALGEMSRSGRFDYGWIESASGEYVWEMTLENTRRAGGDVDNRIFDDVITLPAGRYVAHFHTDFSHAVGDFGDGAPPDPGAWGMRVVRMAE